MKRRKLIASFTLLFIFLCIAGLFLSILFLQTQNADKKIAAWMMHAEYIESEDVTLQTKRSNCGPFALKMIFDHYNISYSINEIEKAVNLNEKGSSMLALKEMAELKGFRVEGWNFALKDFQQIPLPAILYVNEDHYIVADSMSADESVYVTDPAIGRLRITMENLNKIWNGETLIFYDEKKNEDRSNSKSEERITAVKYSHLIDYCMQFSYMKECITRQ